MAWKETRIICIQNELTHPYTASLTGLPRVGLRLLLDTLQRVHAREEAGARVAEQGRPLRHRRLQRLPTASRQKGMLLTGSASGGREGLGNSQGMEDPGNSGGSRL